MLSRFCSSSHSLSEKLLMVREVIMQRKRLRSYWVRRSLGVLLLAVSTPLALPATTHVIIFGGSVGFTYSPGSLSVAVGDTVEWQGSFSTHPLSSTEVPAGAASWTSSSGSVFRYAVAVPGTYDYTCDVHGPSMSGSFTATVSSVEDGGISAQPVSFDLLQNFPNPFNPATTIEYHVPGPGSARVKLAVYNLIGQEVGILVNETKSVGVYSVSFEAAGLPSGVYLYTLTADAFTRTRSMILVR